jgi:hypothetical protein
MEVPRGKKTCAFLPRQAKSPGQTPQGKTGTAHQKHHSADGREKQPKTEKHLAQFDHQGPPPREHPPAGTSSRRSILPCLHG